ncbi:peptide deformylase [Hansschlegelia sp. KR7-227]|uniref:peptide deformylase n=1 Tax=Hansschlegelia sp. KR7-227 TaxID=3400914 RepID=UPI003BFE992D
MAAAPLVYLPDPKLRVVSAPVERVDAATRALVDRMFETMYDAAGIGLAAIQIGEAKRVVVIDLAGKDETPEPLVFINPEIVASSEERQVYEEGCLSIPDYYEEVERPARATVRFLDREGAEQEIEADGLLSVCIQHEIDHLNGVLFIDHISRLKRDRVTKKFEKARAQGELPSFPKRDKRDRREPEAVTP